MAVLNRVLDFMLSAATITGQQLIGILGVFFLFGIVLYVLSRLTRNIFHNARYPTLDIYITGWIGTPIHELGHAVFCILFRHSIDEMKLFTPNSTDGSLGYVSHSYNPKSFYQSVGNFFIGAGPIIFGAIILYMLTYYLLPNHQAISNLMVNKQIERIAVSNLLSSCGVILSFGGTLAAQVFSMTNFSSIGFWVFLYLASCVSSHMALSPPDIKGMWQGLLTIVMILFIVNVIAALLKMNVTPYVMKVHEFSAGFMSLFILAVLISFLNFILSYTVLAFIFLMKERSLLRMT